MRRAVLGLALLVGCTGGMNVGMSEQPDGGGVDDGDVAAPADLARPHAAMAAPPPTAPPSTVPGEIPAKDGANAVTVAAGQEAVYRVEVQPDEHVGFALTFPSGAPGVEMTVQRWVNGAVDELGTTN